MATNLRLSAVAGAALRDAARRTGRSQQDLLREAVDRYLGLNRDIGVRDRAVASGLVRAPTPFRDVKAAIALSGGCSSIDLLDREAGR